MCESEKQGCLSLFSEFLSMDSGILFPEEENKNSEKEKEGNFFNFLFKLFNKQFLSEYLKKMTLMSSPFALISNNYLW